MKTKIFLLVILIAFASCKKDWLSEKRDISVIVPTTLKDLRLLLNNEVLLNLDARGLVESSCDDFFVTKAMVDEIKGTVHEYNAIIWNKEFYEGSANIKDWNEAYKTVLYANVILEAVAKIERNSENGLEYDAIKGSALYYRSRAFLNLVTTFSKYYESATASTDLGIPLKLSADVNERITRPSLLQTYDRILNDINEAIELLPSKTVKTDASKLACYGLLARCYLYMDKFELALDAANKAYAINSSLIDYNTLDVSSSQPFPFFIDEIHIFSNITSYLNMFPGYSNIDEDLYNSYSEDDLRKTIFFEKRADGGIDFKGSYSGSYILFGGTATDEILLIRSECKALANDITGAMADLNTMLIKRFKTGKFLPLVANNKDDALRIIRIERRKELVRRGLRWQDLKRYNRDPNLAKSLTRTVDGTTYTLPPNDIRYVLPIPDNIIQFNGIQQNPR